MSNAQKMLTMLISYFSEKEMQQQFTIKSQTLRVVNAKTLFDYIKPVFTEDQILLTNFISNLFDSINHICSKKSGFKTLLQDQMPYLLNISCDTCHHMHNLIRKFLLRFEKHIENLCIDLHKDFKWSPDQETVKFAATQ